MSHDDHTQPPPATHFLTHIRDTDVAPGETWLAATYATAFLTVLALVLSYAWWWG